MAYLDLVEPDPDKNRRNGLIVFVICVILLGTLVKCAGQNKNNYPFHKPDSVTRITTSWSVMFGVFTPIGNQDTIFVGVCVDSINPIKTERYLFVYYPKNTKLILPRLDIGLEKDGIISLDYYRVFPPYGFVNYLITDEQYEKLRKHKFDYINFHIDDYDIPYVFDEGGEYFVKFFESI